MSQLYPTIIHYHSNISLYWDIYQYESYEHIWALMYYFFLWFQHIFFWRFHFHYLRFLFLLLKSGLLNKFLANRRVPSIFQLHSTSNFSSTFQPNGDDDSMGFQHLQFSMATKSHSHNLSYGGFLWKMEVPPVIIHFSIGFSMKSTNQRAWGSPICGTPHMKQRHNSRKLRIKRWFFGWWAQMFHMVTWLDYFPIPGLVNKHTLW